MLGIATLALAFQAQLNHPILDHVIVTVADPVKARQDFKDLGFSVFEAGKFPADGLENSGIVFSNRSYLELVSVYDPTRKGAQEYLDLLKLGDGVAGFGMRVTDAPGLFKSLQGTRENVKYSETNDWQPNGAKEAKPPKWQWRSVEWKKGDPPGKPFFIEYSDPPPTVTTPGIEEVWIGVRRLEDAAKRYERLGFHGEVGTDDALHAKTERFALTTGTIVLAEPDGPGAVQDFVKLRKEGVFGVSVRVKSLDKYAKAPDHGAQRVSDHEIRAQLHGLWLRIVDGP